MILLWEKELGGFTLVELNEPEVALHMTEPKLHEVTNIIKKARAKSAPGPYQVQYKVH